MFFALAMGISSVACTGARLSSPGIVKTLTTTGLCRSGTPSRSEWGESPSPLRCPSESCRGGHWQSHMCQWHSDWVCHTWMSWDLCVQVWVSSTLLLSNLMWALPAIFLPMSTQPRLRCQSCCGWCCWRWGRQLSGQWSQVPTGGCKVPTCMIVYTCKLGYQCGGRCNSVPLTTTPRLYWNIRSSF